MGTSLSVLDSGSSPTENSRQIARATLRRVNLFPDLFNSPLEINKTAANYITAHGRRMPE
jgi:hypothetical protein